MAEETTARRHLKEDAFRQLRALLLGGEIPAGSLLSERQLVARMGMSKTPIRLALERLARDGFVDILPQRGVRVRELGLQEIIEHYELREAVETWVVRRVAERITDDQLVELRALVSRQRTLRERVEAEGDSLDPGDATAYIELDAELHLVLAGIAGNEAIIRVMRTQRERIARVIGDIILHNRPLLISSIAEHERILDALAHRDGERAAREMLVHLERGKQQFLDRAAGTGRAPGDQRASTRATAHASSSSSAHPPATAMDSSAAAKPSG